MAYFQKLIVLCFLSLWLWGCGAKSEDQQPEATALSFYTANIAQPIVQGRCVICHVQSGLSGHTRLVFSAGSHQDLVNYGVLEQFLASVNNGSALLLTKMAGGESHGGGVIFDSSAAEYQNFSEFLTQLSVTVTAPPVAAGIFSKVNAEPSSKTLRRAALLFAGRLPSAAEVTQAAGGQAQLKATIKSLMQGDAFHQFLTASANDKLLTDAFINDLFLEVVDPNSAHYPILAAKRYNNQSNEFNQWMQRARYGVTRAPLELIAHVVENDLPYTEVLTADYTMVNPQTNEIFAAGASFDSDDPLIFKPGINHGQILIDDQFQAEYSQEFGLDISSHSPAINYPHAGLLNEPAFLNRYPTTDTNRNRARARWTYFHFLGVDIEKSSARTTDPVALADTNNPTMNNPACTVCHQLMDPVAGAFQNYGNEGWYRSSWGGFDALPDSYKYSNGSLFQNGDTWFRDMRSPGLAGALAPDNSNSLQWLAHQIVQDDRFASATVKFWWESVMSEALLSAPENNTDTNYTALVKAFNAQQTIIDDLAADFKTGFDGGAPFNLKDLLVAMVTSPWFTANRRAATMTDAELLALAAVGNSRLLTPAELEAKTKSILGVVWGEYEASWTIKNTSTALADRYNIYYGGIDSVGIIKRAKELNSLMSNVAEAQALTISCPTVLFDMNRSAGQRQLFTEVDRYITPTLYARKADKVTGLDINQPSHHNLSHNLPAGEHRVRLNFTDPYWDAELQQGSLIVLHHITVSAGDGNVLLTVDGQNINSVAGVDIDKNADGDNTSGPYWNSEQGAITGWAIWANGIALPITTVSAGEVTITVVASRKNLPARDITLGMSINSTTANANTDGEQALRKQLQLFHQRLLGEALALNSDELNQSYELLVALWQQRKSLNYPTSAIAWEQETCNVNIAGFWDTDRGAEFYDPHYMQGVWMSLMVYFLTDYYYLHE